MILFDDQIEALAHAVIGAAIEVHRILGPGYLETVYEKAMCHELTLRGIPFECQLRFDVPYKEITAGEGRFDVIVGGRLVVELKAVESIAGIHEQQVVSYLKAKQEKLGLLLNFNVIAMNKGGIHRVIHTR